jgi:thiamine monophosphate kinase
MLLTAGDDYEIVAVVPEPSGAAFEDEAKAKGASVTMIGRIEVPSREVRVLGRDGEAFDLSRKGFAHF